MTAGVRESNKRARRGALIDAAQALVAEHGLDAVTVEMISARAGVSPRTFFNYFDTKDDAVLGFEHHDLDPRIVRVFTEGGPTGALMTDLQVLAAALLTAHAGSHGRAERALALVQSEPRLLQRHLTLVEGHKSRLRELFEARRAVRPFDTDLELLGFVTFLLVRTASLAWERSGYDGDAVEHLPGAAAQLSRLVLDVDLPERPFP